MAAMTAMNADTPSSVVDRLMAAIEGGDLDTVRALYHPDAVVWHNTDGLEQGVEENLRVLAWMTSTLTDIEYADVRRSALDDGGGVVQQHVLSVTTPAGERVHIPACLVVRVDHGRVTRVDEYLDRTHIQPLLAAGR